MSWIERNLPWLLVALVVVTSVFAVGTLAVGVLTLLAGVIGGASLGATLAGFAGVLTVTATLVALDVALVLGLFVTVVRRLSLPSIPRSDRAARNLRRVEFLFPPARALGLSERFEPTVEDRTRELKRRYVEGELAEAEFERALRALLDDREPSPATADAIQRELDAAAGASASGSRVPVREVERESS